MTPTPRPDERWLVVAAAEVEVAALRRALEGKRSGPDILVAGVGAAGDPVVARELAERPPGCLLNLGFAGGLDDRFGPGSVVLTTEWVAGDSVPIAAETDPELRSRLRRWLEPSLPGVREATGITVEAPFHDAGGALRETTGALTVEMEGARWAGIAREAGWRFVAIRVVSDRADLRLPRPRHELLDGAGRIRLLRWVRALGSRERTLRGEWRALHRARRDWLAALGTLETVSRLVADRLAG